MRPLEAEGLKGLLLDQRFMEGLVIPFNVRQMIRIEVVHPSCC